ncbi:MAG TPA: efflux RND transporter permease subunit [Candidatus Acidoferrales bacterium]|nr:efflux RND transporter permease subunit [Candidatus Acidoferrales bacterium]
MNITELFIRRPVMTTLVMFAILLFGVLGYRKLPVNDLPNVDFPTINVHASLPGASPETMASSVALPLEKQFSAIAGLSSMSSQSVQGSTSISLQFSLDRSVDSAGQDVQSAISRSGGQLPPGMPAPPTFFKSNPADQPVLFISVNSATMPIYQVDRYAENLLAQRISMVEGVAEVQVHGSAQYAVRIQLDPKALASRKIGLDDVVSAVQGANVNLPTGTLWGANQAYIVQASGQLQQAAPYRQIIVAYRGGSPVRLGDLGQVIDGIQDNKQISWFNRRRAVTLAVMRQPGTNTVAVTDAVKKLIPELQSQIPPSVNLETLYDRSRSIRQSVSDVKFSLWLAICLVVMVIFLFLRNVSATIIPSLALPMAIVGTFAGMYELGYTLDNLSLMALTLSVGFVVDDAIVMLENIVRHMEMGESTIEAALSGSKEIGFTILSMTASLAAVFLPVLFMGGILGRLLHEFAVVIMMAVLVSGFVSLTLTPMLCSRFLRPPNQQRHGRLYQTTQRGFDAMLDGYSSSLRWCLRHRLFTLSIGGVILLVTVWQFWVIRKGFLPSEDTGQIFAYFEATQGISYDAMVAHGEVLNAIAKADPNIANFSSSVGGFTGTINTGHLFMRLKDPGDRAWVDSRAYRWLRRKAAGHPAFEQLVVDLRSALSHHMNADEVIAELRPKFDSVPGLRVFPQNPPSINIGGHLTKSQYQYALQGPNTAELYQYSQILEDKMKKLPGLEDITSDLQLKNPQVNVEIDRDKAAALGVSPQQIENALYTAYGSRQVSTIYAPDNEYWVVMELEPQYQADPAALSMLYVRSSTGQLVPLDALTRTTHSYGPLTVNHIGQVPAVTLSFDLAPGFALGDAVNEMQQLARQTLPADLNGSFQGTAQAFQGSLVGLGVLLLLTLLVIYIILGILYESFIHPITILSGLPSAAVGGLLTLMVFGHELNLYGFVGLIMLIGIIKKNAIMMIDFALAAQRTDNKPPAEAIYHGAVIRFRPIMMTTMSAIMGTLPIALGWGTGAQSRRPLGLVVTGGLIFSQVVTLYLTPVFYTYMESFTAFLGRLRHRPVPELVPAAAGGQGPGGAVFMQGGEGPSGRRR